MWFQVVSTLRTCSSPLCFAPAALVSVDAHDVDVQAAGLHDDPELAPDVRAARGTTASAESSLTTVRRATPAPRRW